MPDVGRQLDDRFRRTVERERRSADPIPDSFPPLEIPRALHATIVRAHTLDPDGDHAAIITHYTERMPAERIDQLHRSGDLREVLREPLELARMPRFSSGIQALFEHLRRSGLDPIQASGHADAHSLLRARPTIAALHANGLFGRGLPFLGAHAAERQLIAADLAAGASLPEVLDRRVSGNLLHELAHGTAHPSSAPWFVLEAAAAHLGVTAFEGHLFPEETAVAIPGFARFELLGGALARLFGETALASLTCGIPFAEAFPEPVVAALEAASWADYFRRRAPPFVLDALDAQAWVKLADANRAGIKVEMEQVRTLPWSSLPWWSEEPTPADTQILRHAVLSMCLVNVLAPTFQTNPSDPPDGVLELDIEACELRAKRRSNGVFAEPARGLVPPSVARKLWERGARTVRIEGVTHANRLGKSADLIAFVQDRSPLAAVATLA